MHPSVGLRAVGVSYLTPVLCRRREMHGSPKFLTSLFPRATRLRPRRSHRALAMAHPCCWLPWILSRRPPVGLLTRLIRFGEVHLPCGPRDSLSTLRLCRSVVSFLSSHPQDSVRFEGLTLVPSGFRLQGTFGRDFHPARDAKLRLAHSSGTRNQALPT